MIHTENFSPKQASLDSSSDASPIPRTISAPSRKARGMRRATSRTSLRFRSQHLPFISRRNPLAYTPFCSSKITQNEGRPSSIKNGESVSKESLKGSKGRKKVAFCKIIQIFDGNCRGPRSASVKGFLKSALKPGAQKEVLERSEMDTTNTSPKLKPFLKRQNSIAKPLTFKMCSDKIATIKKRPTGLKRYVVGISKTFAKQVAEAEKEASNKYAGEQETYSDASILKDIVTIKAPYKSRRQTQTKTFSNTKNTIGNCNPSSLTDSETPESFPQRPKVIRKNTDFVSRQLPGKSRNKKHSQVGKAATIGSNREAQCRNEVSFEATNIPRTISKPEKR